MKTTVSVEEVKSWMSPYPVHDELKEKDVLPLMTVSYKACLVMEYERMLKEIELLKQTKE